MVNHIISKARFIGYKLRFEKPYFHSKRISDFEKVKLQYINPSPFKARNVYFDLHGIERI